MVVALVIGAAGQDGRWLTRALLAEGAEVYGTIRPGGTATVEPGVRTHEMELRDTDTVRALIARLAPDELYHLAADSSVAASWDDPRETLAATGLPTATILDTIARQSPRTRFVHAASAEIFGDAAAPQNEQTPIRPLSPYGIAKTIGHLLVGSYRMRGIHASSCILFNHESPLRPERFVTTRIARTAARIAAGLETGLVLGNLDARRDWGWAPDYTDALQRAIRHPEPGDYVIGTGVSHTVRQFAIAALTAAGVDDPESRLLSDPALVRPLDIVEQRADSRKAREVLGWEPTVGFEELVARLVEHHRAAL